MQGREKPGVAQKIECAYYISRLDPQKLIPNRMDVPWQFIPFNRCVIAFFSIGELKHVLSAARVGFHSLNPGCVDNYNLHVRDWLLYRCDLKGGYRLLHSRNAHNLPIFCTQKRVFHRCPSDRPTGGVQAPHFELYGTGDRRFEAISPLEGTVWTVQRRFFDLARAAVQT